MTTEIMTAIVDDKASSMSTSNTTVANPHVQSPTMSGDHDKPWTSAIQTSTNNTDPNQHGMYVYSQ